MDFSEKGAVWPVQYLLNLLIFRVMTPVSAVVTNGDHLRNTKVHLPPGECLCGFLESLEDPINIVNMVMEKMMDSGIFHSDLVKQMVQS